MKTILLSFAKSLCVVLFTLFWYPTASAGHEKSPWYDDDNWATVDGFVYKFNYDNSSEDYPPIITATLVDRDTYFDSITGYYSYCPIQYDEWNTDSILYLPTMIGDCEVTAIDGGFGGFKDIKTVSIPPTVTSIRRGVFANSSLETIIFEYDGNYNSAPPISFGKYDPEDIDYSYLLNRGEFMNCERLTTVRFHRPLANIPSFMFYNCPKLENIIFDDYFFNPDEMIVDTIGEGAFEHCNNLKKLKIPHGITTSIGDYAFAECNKIEEITINPSLHSIGKAAFCNCRTLSSIDIPDAVTEIKDYTFYDCQNLTNLNIKNVTTFGDHALAGCNKLPYIDLTKTQSIGKAAFMGGEVFCSIWIHPDRPNDQAIAYCEEQISINLGSIRKIILGEAITELNEWTFGGHIPDSIICMAPVPPRYTNTSAYDYTFSPEAYQTSVLCVPKILVMDYREAYGWKRFTHIDGITILGNGDVNEDGRINISDVVSLIDKILGGQNDYNLVNADVNGDGRLTIGDVTSLIDKLLNSN